MYTHLSDLHPIQAGILRTLLFTPKSTFTAMNILQVPSDQFSFHLRKLVTDGVLMKQDDGYSLTTHGKQVAQLLDTDSGHFEKQAKISVAIGSIRVEGGHTQYLIQERLKEPYYGYNGLLTGKVRWGETVLEAAARELERETGLSADLRIIAIKHKMDYAADGTLLEDKFFYIIRAENLSGPFKHEYEGGRNIWITKKELEELDKVFEGVEDSLHWLESPQLTFKEVKYSVKGY